MKASETQFKVIVGGEKQYIIPLFQRPYTWDKTSWSALWADVMETYELGLGARHFLGSVVTKSLSSTPDGVASYLVIDGQQRLTTLALLLAALRDSSRPALPNLADKIHNLYLTNQYASGIAGYKVLPTQLDRPGFFKIINDPQSSESDSRTRDAYLYFMSQLAQPDLEGNAIDLNRMEQVIMSGLEIVSITLDPEDNEYRIFESLNYKGVDLTQADLLRNYFFMRISSGSQERVYNNIWLPMQDSLGSKTLADFFRYEYLSSGRFVRESDVYQDWKKELDTIRDEQGLIERLERFALSAQDYRCLVQPEYAKDSKIRSGLERLNRWGGQTVYPFLLVAYRRHRAGDLSGTSFAELLRLIESFLIRRLFAGVPTNALNRLFNRLAQQLPADTDFVTGTRIILSEPSRRWPRDHEFKLAILRYPLYTDSRPEQRRLILESLEHAHGHHEEVRLDDLTIEHVMPQTLSQDWEQTLGANAKEQHRKLVHTLGNLTLTGYNPEMSNKPFTLKRPTFMGSNLLMNREIGEATIWNAEAIEARGAVLAERAVHIWPGPVETSQTAPRDSGSGEPTSIDQSEPLDRRALWPDEALCELLKGATLSQQIILRRLASTPDQWVSIHELAAALGADTNRFTVTGVLGSLTKRCLKEFGIEWWPFEVQLGPLDKLPQYRMPASIAAIIAAPSA